MAKAVEAVDFDFVQDGLGTNSILLVDVRSMEARLDFGRIPGSRHVPIDRVATAFSVAATTDAEFEKEFDFVRPTKKNEEETVTSSEQPKLLVFAADEEEEDSDGLDLALKAAEILQELGYQYVAHYPRALSDWRQSGGSTLKGRDDEKKEVDFDEVRRGRDDAAASVVLIDVRSKAERIQTGVIRSSINMPLNELWSLMKLSEEAFEARFGLRRAELSHKKVVLHCLKGKRALEAADKLMILGYNSNVFVYKGSFSDWIARGGSIVEDKY